VNDLLPPWRDLDDDALLAHFRSRRSVRFEPVIDPEEITAERIEGVMHGRFEFVGQTHRLADPIDWLANPSSDVEWHILLHKFYYAAGLAQAWQASGDARYVARWTALLDGWMAQVPPGFIAADVTGRRVQNWIYALHGFVLHDRHGAPVDAAFFRRVLHSLHGQVEFLCANLTAKRNHRTLELLAIFLAGVVFPEFAASARWREFALAQTLANVEADLLPDGVHCELSTDYHHLALRNWMQVRQLAAHNGVAVPAAFDAALQRAFDFALAVHQPGGGMPSFSDGDARGFEPLLLQGAQMFGRDDLRFVATRGAQGREPASRNAHFAASGYHVLRSGWGRHAQHLVFDCGPLGEGNHGHFDALSFELAACGRPLVVDPGRYTYSEAGEVNWRVHFRHTAAHSTVCVDGRTQTLYEPRPVKEPSRHAQGAVRHKIAGPAPECTLIESLDGERIDLLHGRCTSHAYDAVHERCIVFVDRRYWIVADTLRAPSVHDYALKFQLGAQAQGGCALGSDGVLASPGLVIAQLPRAGQQAVVADAWVSARYGHKRPAPALLTRQRARDAEFDSVLLPWRGRPAQAAVSALPARADDGSEALALDIRLRADDLDWHDGWFHARSAAARTWRIGELVFTGRWLHWRIGADGRVVRAVSHAGALLREGTRSVALATEVAA
jgi:hypothetical protein